MVDSLPLCVSVTCSVRWAFLDDVVCHTVGALYFGNDLANLEVRLVSHAVVHFLRLLAEWIERAILLEVGLQRFFIRMRLELMNQLLDCFLADAILLLDSRMGQSLDPEDYFTATTFVVRSTTNIFLCLLEWSKDVLESKLVVSWRP